MANIVLRLSTGDGNSTQTNPNLSLGGNLATNVEAVIDTSNTSLNNLFDDITKSENFAGTTDYRCIFIMNDTVTPGHLFANGEVFLTGSSYASVSVGLDPGGVSSPAVIIPDEETVPAGVVFDTPTESSPLTFPATLNPGEYIAMWIRRTANQIAGTGSVTDAIGITVRGIE